MYTYTYAYKCKTFPEHELLMNWNATKLNIPQTQLCISHEHLLEILGNLGKNWSAKLELLQSICTCKKPVNRFATICGPPVAFHTPTVFAHVILPMPEKYMSRLRSSTYTSIWFLEHNSTGRSTQRAILTRSRLRFIASMKQSHALNKRRTSHVTWTRKQASNRTFNVQVKPQMFLVAHTPNSCPPTSIAVPGHGSPSEKMLG